MSDNMRPYDAAIIGNDDLISNDEVMVAALLRERNLERVNSSSEPVHPRDSFYARHGKRMLDIAVSLPAFVLLLPVNGALALCTLLDVGRPVLFRQTRVGLGGELFTLVKFRNMSNETDADGKLLPVSERVTRFGSFVRKYSLDELLNFWSVLVGDMSIIGPRPQPVFIYERMSERHKSRTLVRPGLECPRVIHVPGEEVCKFQRTFENDVWYVENVSLGLDLKMLWRLVRMVFSLGTRGNQAKGKGISYFVGYNDDGYAISMNVYRESMNGKGTR